MQVQDAIIPKISKNLLTTNRAFGAVGMIFSPMLFFGSFFYAPENSASHEYQIFASLGGILYLFGAMASATAMRKVRVTGEGFGAGVLYFMQMTGLFLAMRCDALEYAAPQLRGSVVFFITDMAYPFSHLLMAVVGALVVRAGVWHGWRTLGAFMVGFALPAVFVLAAILGRDNAEFIFPLLTTAGFFVLGCAVFTAQPSTKPFENSKWEMT